MRDILQKLAETWSSFKEWFKSKAISDSQFGRKLLMASMALFFVFVFSIVASIYVAPVAAIAVLTGLAAVSLFTAHRKADAIYEQSHPSVSVTPGGVTQASKDRFASLVQQAAVMQGYGTAGAVTKDAAAGNLTPAAAKEDDSLLRPKIGR